MSDITTISASNVVPNATTAVIARGTAGAAITAGQIVYQDANGKIQLAAQTTSTTAHVVGIAVNSAASGAPVDYVTQGDVALGTVFTKGNVLVLGAGAGLMSASADLDGAPVNTRYANVVGVASSANNLRVGIVNTDVQK